MIILDPPTYHFRQFLPYDFQFWGVILNPPTYPTIGRSINNKVGNQKKLRPPTFKTDIIKVVLVFSISNFYTNKSSQGRNSVREKSTFVCKFSFKRERPLMTSDFRVGRGVQNDPQNRTF